MTAAIALADRTRAAFIAEGYRDYWRGVASGMNPYTDMRPAWWAAVWDCGWMQAAEEDGALYDDYCAPKEGSVEMGDDDA